MRLRRAMREHGPLCVGIDPHPRLLAAWGLPRTAAGLETFSLTALEAAAGHAAAVKPQVALYEAYGSAGFAVLERLLREAREAQVLSIADAKRGDIGSTMAAYAHAWLAEDSPLAADAVTLSPYLGFGSLRPAFDLARHTGRGTFVLALTSNPEGAGVQHAGGAQSVAKRVLAAVQEENEGDSRGNSAVIPGNPGAPDAGTFPDDTVSSRGITFPGSCGVVIGATVGDALRRLEIDLEGFTGPVLAPGYGAQGADARALGSVFQQVAANVLANSSRAVLRRGPSVSALREAMDRSASELREAL